MLLPWRKNTPLFLASVQEKGETGHIPVLHPVWEAQPECGPVGPLSLLVPPLPQVQPGTADKSGKQGILALYKTHFDNAWTINTFW